MFTRLLLLAGASLAVPLPQVINLSIKYFDNKFKFAKLAANKSHARHGITILVNVVCEYWSWLCEYSKVFVCSNSHWSSSNRNHRGLLKRFLQSESPNPTPVSGGKVRGEPGVSTFQLFLSGILMSCPQELLSRFEANYCHMCHNLN